LCFGIDNWLAFAVSQVGLRTAAIAGGAQSLHRYLYVGAALSFCLIVWVCLSPCLPVDAGGSVMSSDPTAVCVSCHRDIYEKYRNTPMANASGSAAQGFIAAGFLHQASGVHYRIDEDRGRVWLRYERDDPARALSGQRELRYFIGSGKRGRTYLFEQQGYWFEAPINWYGKKQLWDMAPNYLTVREMPLTMPVDPGCLHCHASNVASSLPEARNHYAAAPFAHGGITCEACHGDASAHVASGGKISMLNIDRLEPVRRDSVCLNCHLEGQAAVDRKGMRIEDFKPGDNLFDYTLYFVYRGENGSGGRATSQWEALLKSACMQRSSTKLTCTTCHDPHGSPPPEKRVAFYRQKCLQCHTAPGFAASHHAENPDCTSCHMARPPSNDIAHEQVTDHWIRKRVSQERLPLATSGELMTVGGVPADDREIGLAYAQMAARGDQQAAAKAIDLLRRSEKHEDGAGGDHVLHAQLGFLEQVDGGTESAENEYERALAADPYDALAAGDLALIEAKQHRLGEAAREWGVVFEHDPSQLGAGMNLAITECAMGETGEALQTLERMLTFSPDDGQARGMARDIRSGRRRCVGK
jgi:predicted CXXCH cytochrome family protein